MEGEDYKRDMYIVILPSYGATRADHFPAEEQLLAPAVASSVSFKWSSRIAALTDAFVLLLRGWRSPSSSGLTRVCACVVAKEPVRSSLALSGR